MDAEVNDVLLFLNNKDMPNRSDVYFSIDNFSGIVKLQKNPDYLEKI